MENGTGSEAPVMRQRSDDSVLREVVAKLIERYRKDAAASKAAEVDDCEIETVILPRGAGAGKATAAEDAPITETVLLSAAYVQERAPLPATDEATETVVLSPASRQGVEAPPPSDAAITETVLLGPSSRQETGKFPGTDAAVTETVVLSPASVPTRLLPDSDEAVTETVLIQPTGNYDQAFCSGTQTCSDNSILETVLLTPGSKAPLPDSRQQSGHSVQPQTATPPDEGDFLETMMAAPRHARPQVERDAGGKKDDGSAR